MASSARIEELQKKFDENPRRYFAPLANEYRKAGDIDQAIFICQEYLPQQPGHMSGHIVYGQALYEAHRREEARTVFETALTLDPENLIALRHLGDIARELGDSETARGWYQRVLEADPRNEEIAGLLASLTSIDVEVPAQDAVASAPAAPGAPEPIVDAPLETAPTESPLADFAALVEEVQLEAEAPQAPLPPAAELTTPHAAADSDVLDLEATDFAFGGASSGTSSGAPQPLPEPAQPSADEGLGSFGIELESTVPGTSAAPAADAMEGLPSLDGLVATHHEGDSEAGGAAPGVAPLEGLDLVDTGAEPVSSVHGLESQEFTAPEEPIAQTPGATDLLDFEMPPSAEAAPTASESAAGDTPPAEPPVFDLPTSAAPEIDSEPEPERAAAETQAPAPEPEVTSGGSPFVTETMAELYLRQGHREEALGVYRQLATARPDDEALRRRITEVEQEGAAEAANEAAAPSGPTIRDVLSAIATRAPRYASAPVEDGQSELETGHGNAPGDHAAGAVTDYEQSSYSDVAEETLDVAAPEAESEPAHDFEPVDEEPTPDVPVPAANPTPSNGQATIGGSIDALFSGAEAAADDMDAAEALSDAFTPAEDEAPVSEPVASGEEIQGNPARRASDELSLDRVFREATPAQGQEASAFSFDQFFSGDASDRGSGPATPEQPGAAQGAPDDIEQFNAWLEGLKKS